MMMKNLSAIALAALVLAAAAVLGACDMEPASDRLSLFDEYVEEARRDEEQRKLPETPLLPSISAADSQISANWKAAARADYYEVFYSTGTTPPATPAKTTYGTSAVITGLANGTPYSVWVRGVNAHGAGALSVRAEGMPAASNTVPAAPGQLSVVAGDAQLSASWQPVDTATGYEIYYNSTATPPGTPAKTETEAASTISGLTNGSTYYVWVKAVNAKGAGALSPVGSGVPLASKTAPAAPKMPAVTAGDAQITASWEAVNGAGAYEIWYGTDAGSASAKKYGADTSDLSATVTGLVNDTTYYVWIKAKNPIGASDFSSPASGKPAAALVPPSAPEAPAVESGDKQLSLRWTAVPGAVSYDVYCDTGTAPVTKVKTVNTNTASITGLDNGTEYYVRIKALNTVGASEYSPAASGKPFGTIPAPGKPVLRTSDGTIAVSWNAVAEADRYDVYYRSGSNIPPEESAETVTGTETVIAGLVNGTIYNVWVKAKGPGGASTFSTMASGKPVGWRCYNKRGQ